MSCKPLCKPWLILKKMIDAGLTALLTTLKNNPQMARIIYIDAMLVQELHNQATIHETMSRFDRMIQAFVMLMMPHLDRPNREISLVAQRLKWLCHPNCNSLGDERFQTIHGRCFYRLAVLYFIRCFRPFRTKEQAACKDSSDLS